MVQIKKSTLSFLSDLKVNNDKEWFAANRKRYEDSRENFYSFVQVLINSIGAFDPSIRGLEVSNCIYRINRDIRFSIDKSIYKTHFGAFIVKGGKKNGDKYAGYYFHIEPGNHSLIAGGAYKPPPEWLSAIREKIDDQGDLLLKIIKDREFARYFRSIEGEKLKTAPRGYPGNHKHIELLKMKSYLIACKIPDNQIVSKSCIDFVVNVSRTMKPFNDFLNEY
ncbi:MAG: DUF2461 domain-containing protein [Bacteroidales bacterium]|jgi:uncharacterized protein (TIGR02453 family)